MRSTNDFSAQTDKSLLSNTPRKQTQRKLIRSKNKTISRLSNKLIKIKKKSFTEKDMKNTLDTALTKLLLEMQLELHSKKSHGRRYSN